MSSSDRLPGAPRRIVAGAAAALLALGLAGCTVTPVFMAGSTEIGARPGVSAELAAISIASVSGRVAQQVRNDLIFAFTGGGDEADPLYDLSLQVTSSETRLGFDRDESSPAYSVTVTAVYELTEIKTGRSVTRGTSRGVASYDRSNQQFANERALIDAQDRASQLIAEDMRLRIAAVLVRDHR
ncbi:LPS assembly lipoprotein LptE [Prosthecomicrobium pneumaticum]|uniref:LPS-assembly lipoprotein n=1 Tax=Prosthecomicrobium pneumaticum TaxID=81895 RepID=A0A7W9L328_9HYPH|nr:LPS assembly lipoprotein LptE [Prosthecomicrobium pneumaticum]MBB5754117.1 LPS-assembly lipoprotein [Prosthecomicrobium pneumaticum]